MLTPDQVLAQIPHGELLVALLSGFSMLTAITAVWFGLIDRHPGIARARAIARRRAELGAAIAGPEKARSRAQLNLAPGAWLAQRMRRAHRERAQEIRRKLAAAGWRSDGAFDRFVLAKLILPLLGAAVVAALYFGGANGTTTLDIGYALAGAVAGYFAPDLMVLNQTQKREQKLRQQLPDALDLLVICAQAGLSLDASLARVAGEMRLAGPDIADELALTSVELGFLPDRRQALGNLGQRIALPEVRSLVGMLTQTERYGTPVSRSLKILVEQFRHERLMRAEEKAARLPATMTVPMILFIMPSLFIVLGGPAFMRLREAFAQM